jgi:hypothetical protein
MIERASKDSSISIGNDPGARPSCVDSLGPPDVYETSIETDGVWIHGKQGNSGRLLPTVKGSVVAAGRTETVPDQRPGRFGDCDAVMSVYDSCNVQCMLVKHNYAAESQYLCSYWWPVSIRLEHTAICSAEVPEICYLLALR